MTLLRQTTAMEFPTNEPMKVWLVYTGEYSDMRVQGVFSSEALADEAAKAFGRNDAHVGEAFTIDASVAPTRDGYQRWFVSIFPDGRAYTDVSGLANGQAPAIIERPNGDFGVHCDARDKEHALKIAADAIRAQKATPQNNERARGRKHPARPLSRMNK